MESRRPPPPPQDVWRTPAPQGVGDYDLKHYVLGSFSYPDMCKTGRTTKRMDERLREINSQQSKDLGLYVILVYHHEGALEHRVRCKLDAWGYGRPPVEYGVNGSEFRIVCVDTVKAAVDEVRQECERASPNMCPQSLDEKTEAWCKRRRLCLQVRREEFELEKAKRDYELEMAKRELALEEQSFDLAKRRSSWRRPPTGTGGAQ